MNRITIWILVSSTCLIGGAMFLGRAQPAAPKASDLETRLARTEARLASVQAQVTQTDRRPTPTREIVTQPAADEAEAESSTQPASQPLREVVDPVARVQERMEAEGRDPNWAPSSERALQTAYRAVPGSQLEAVECRSSVCQMTFSHEDEEAIDGFRLHLARENPLPDSSMLVRMQPNGAGEQESLVFVARSGHGLARR